MVDSEYERMGDEELNKQYEKYDTLLFSIVSRKVKPILCEYLEIVRVINRREE